MFFSANSRLKTASSVPFGCAGVYPVSAAKPSEVSTLGGTKHDGGAGGAHSHRLKSSPDLGESCQACRRVQGCHTRSTTGSPSCPEGCEAWPRWGRAGRASSSCSGSTFRLRETRRSLSDWPAAAAPLRPRTCPAQPPIPGPFPCCASTPHRQASAGARVSCIRSRSRQWFSRCRASGSRRSPRCARW